MIVCFYHVMYVFQSESRMANLAKWLSVRLQTKWLWIRVPLQSLSIQCITVLLIWLLSTLLPLVVLVYPLIVLICPLVVLICPLIVLVYSLVVLVCQLVVLVYPFVCLLVVLIWPFVSPVTVLIWPFIYPLVVLVVLSASLFMTDPYNDNKMIILILYKSREYQLVQTASSI